MQKHKTTDDWSINHNARDIECSTLMPNSSEASLECSLGYQELDGMLEMMYNLAINFEGHEELFESELQTALIAKKKLDEKRLAPALERLCQLFFSKLYAILEQDTRHDIFAYDVWTVRSAMIPILKSNPLVLEYYADYKRHNLQECMIYEQSTRAIIALNKAKRYMCLGQNSDTKQEELVSQVMNLLEKYQDVASKSCVKYVWRQIEHNQLQFIQDLVSPKLDENSMHCISPDKSIADTAKTTGGGAGAMEIKDQSLESKKTTLDQRIALAMISNMQKVYKKFDQLLKYCDEFDPSKDNHQNNKLPSVIIKSWVANSGINQREQMAQIAKNLENNFALLENQSDIEKQMGQYLEKFLQINLLLSTQWSSKNFNQVKLKNGEIGHLSLRAVEVVQDITPQLLSFEDRKSIQFLEEGYWHLLNSVVTCYQNLHDSDSFLDQSTDDQSAKDESLDKHKTLLCALLLCITQHEIWNRERKANACIRDFA